MLGKAKKASMWDRHSSSKETQAVFNLIHLDWKMNKEKCLREGF